MKIPFVDFGQQYRNYKIAIDTAMHRVLNKGELILQDDVKEFEKEFAAFVGTKYAVGLNSGTDALYLALRALGIGKGDEVITVSHTFIATIESIVRVGATPVLIDIDDTYLMDVTQIEGKITEKTKAIIPVHLSGDVCDMYSILEIAKRHNLKVIEDAAQAIGAPCGGKNAGAIGDIGCFSFYPAKILGAFGDAGAIATDSEELAEKIKKYRHHSYIGKNLGVENDTVEYGINSRLDNLQAAVLREKLKKLPDMLKTRKAAAEVYDSALKGSPELILPRERAVYQDYVIRTKRRDELKAALDAAGIETLGAGLIPNHTYKGLGLNFSLPKTEAYTNEFLRLPCNAEIPTFQIKEVADVIRKFYGIQSVQ